MRRRAFIKSSVAMGAGLLIPLPFWGEEKEQVTALKEQVMTVLGPISPAELGLTLTHEHVLVDFIGADRVSPDRNVSSVLRQQAQEIREGFPWPDFRFLAC